MTNQNPNRAPIRDVSKGTIANVDNANNNNITEEKPQTVVQNTVQSEVQKVKTDVPPVVKQTVKKNPEIVISTHVKRERQIVVRLSEDEYQRLLDFVNDYTPRTTISDVVRSGVNYITENIKQTHGKK